MTWKDILDLGLKHYEVLLLILPLAFRAVRRWIVSFLRLPDLYETVDMIAARQRALPGLLRNAMWEADVEGNWTWVNRSMMELARTWEQDLLGTGWIGLIHMEDRDRVAREWAAAVRYQRDVTLKFKLLIPREGDGARIDHVVVLMRATVLHGLTRVRGFHGTLGRCVDTRCEETRPGPGPGEDPEEPVEGGR